MPYGPSNSRRHRVLAAWSTARGGSTLLQLASYPLLPRARWPDAVFAPHTLLVNTHPLASTLIYCALDLFVGVSASCRGLTSGLTGAAVNAVLVHMSLRYRPGLALPTYCTQSISRHASADLLVLCSPSLLLPVPPHGPKFPFLAASKGILLHTAAALAAAYAIAPHIVDLEHGVPDGSDDNRGSTGSSGAEGRWPNKCHTSSQRQLLSCRPVWQQTLLAGAIRMVALPLALAALSQCWLWRCYVTALRRRAQEEQQLQQQGKQEEQQQVQDQRQREQPEEEQGSALLKEQLARHQILRSQAHNPHLELPLPSHLREQSKPVGTGGSRRAVYQGMGTWQNVSVKVSPCSGHVCRTKYLHV